jgi:hypothetical protein
MNGEIVIQTRRGRNILLARYPEEPPMKVAAYARRFSREYPEIVMRRGATSEYNCYGLLFACRRAWVMIESVGDILSDDGFRKVRVDEGPIPGDIVLYFEGIIVEHVGLIVDVPRLGESFIPRVLSKWAPGPEYVHAVARCPFGIRYEFWTERP